MTASDDRVLVPRKPTTAMCDAAFVRGPGGKSPATMVAYDATNDGVAAVYSAMITVGESKATPPTTYRGYHIYFDAPPIPTRSCDWHFYHDDYDGAPDAGDNRYGHGPTEADCREQIDEIEEWDQAARDVAALTDQ